jgi:uncharacterized protein
MPLELAVLFGSGAQNRLRPDSDLDVGIIPSTDLTLRDELDMAATLTAASGREVDLVRLDQPSVLLRWEAAKSHVLLLARTPGALPQFLARAALDHADFAPMLADASRRLTRRLAMGHAPKGRR